MSTNSAFHSVEGFFKLHPNIKFARLQWVDASGILRTRIVPLARCLSIAQGQCSYKFTQNAISPVPTPPDDSTEKAETWQLHPVWTSLRPLTWAPLHASIMCNAKLEADEHACTTLRCPRTLAAEAVSSFEELHQTKLTVGFEIEFVLLGTDLELHAPFDRVAGNSTTCGLRSSSLKLVEDVIDALEKANIPIWHFHTETVDQLEIALAPMSPLEAIDTVVFAEEAIRSITAMHGLKASLAPRPLLTDPQNGLHLHVSLQDKSKSDHFLAGVLDKLNPLCIFGMPSYDSYVRVRARKAGLFVGWGSANKGLPIRKMNDGHWEMRFLDATANPYLFFALLLFAASKGVRDHKKLTWKDCNVRLENGDDVSKVAEYGITKPMPDCLSAALKELQNDEDIQEWMGSDMFKRFTKMKEKDIEQGRKMTDDERRLNMVTFF